MARPGTRRRAIRPSALVGIALLAAMHAATPAAAESVSLTGTANATLIDQLTLMNFSGVEAGVAGAPATLELLPSGPLAGRGGPGSPAQESFSAVFTLAGTPNQTYGITFPASVTLTSGGAADNVRAVIVTGHDAGLSPVLANTGRSRFQVGAVLDVHLSGTKMTEAYAGALDVIVSNN